MRFPLFAALITMTLATSPLAAQLSPDDVAGARRLLAERAAVAADSGVARANQLIRQHRYEEAERLVDAALRRAPRAPEWLHARTRLLIQAWRLPEALRVARSFAGGAVLAGRIQLLEKDFAAALATAKTVQAAEPRNSEAQLLEADVHFWNQQPQLAEAPLRRALELDPLNADARFAYGYAIWRRVDARQLPAMAAQWNLALDIDPLHYITHWHFGNGHTHLTYADYAQPADSIVRVLLRGADSLVMQDQLIAAAARTREIEAQYPQALLPALTRGSIFYLAAELDSAQAVFQALLRRKPNYGPAHNGLAAVIKQRQFRYHAQYDSLEQAIERQAVPRDSAFYRVLKDVRYYPGERVSKMAAQQLGPALAYIPLLARLGYTYTVPPLHHDLTDALAAPYFRTATTFDHRQWMDIRGAGGNHAAAGIEYVERGSHQERVVLLHEYVHQFHGAVLTDAENRRIRQLYHEAVANGRALDYYAPNNESEFLAQSYEAYLTPVKVHPLNHKSMNTTADLRRKDPRLYAFLDSLVVRNRAFLQGDEAALRSNWAQVYVTLAQRASPQSAHALLDTAAAYDPRYVPALLRRAAVYRAEARWADVERTLAEAARLAPSYAPVLVERAQLPTLSLEAKAELYQRAWELEADLAERADINRRLRELYYDHARMAEAIEAAESYARSAPALSTYLRDRRDEAAAFAAELRSRLGYAAQEARFFNDLLQRKPQHFGHRAQAIAVNLQADNAPAALRLLDEGERVLRAGGQRPTSYMILRALAMGATPQSAMLIDSVLARGPDQLSHVDRVRVASFLLFTGRADDAAALLPADSSQLNPRERADYLHLRGELRRVAGDAVGAMTHYRAALEANPYLMSTRLLLVFLLAELGDSAGARAAADVRALEFPLGEAYQRDVRAILGGQE